MSVTNTFIFVFCCFSLIDVSGTSSSATSIARVSCPVLGRAESDRILEAVGCRIHELFVDIQLVGALLFL